MLVRRVQLKRFSMALMVIGLIIVGVSSFSNSALAQQRPGVSFGLQPIAQSTALSTQDIRLTVARIIRAVLGLLGIIALVIVLYAGYLYMTAGGNEEQISNSKKMLVNAVIGLAIILSAFSITQFIITRLASATGTMVQNEPLDSACSDPTYASAHRDICGGSFNCAADHTCCTIQHFVVRSITPNTPRGGSIGMNNVAIRVIFSQPLQSGFQPDQVFDINRSGAAVNGNVNRDFDFRYLDDNHSVVEARPRPVAATTFIPRGNYDVVVKDAVRSAQGQPLEHSLTCGQFDQQASFRVTSTGVNDNVPPTVSPITIAGRQQVDMPLRRGNTYALSSSITDNSGIGYAHLVIARDGGGNSVTVYDGPATNRGSQATNQEPYVFSYPLLLAANTTPLQHYTVTLTVFDIDHNSREQTTSFVVVGENCDEYGHETVAGSGSSCLGNGACDYNWQCDSGRCDTVTHTCVASPIIYNVDPWDGAGGNYITITGRYFGETRGTVSFGLDPNRDGRVAQWVPVSLAQCGQTAAWHDQYIIAEVPRDNAAFPVGSYYAIRVARADSPALADTTIDAVGLRGYFLKNTIQRPGLCPIDPPDASPGRAVTLRGNGFSTSLSANQVFFGGVQGSVSNATLNSIATQVPLNLQPGTVGVSVRVGSETSNGVRLNILSSAEDQNPVISSVDPNSTRESYITISGSHFGSTGRVYFAPNTTAVCPQPGCVAAQASLPAVCGITWSDTQIIAQVPPDSAIQLGTYYLVVQNAIGRQNTPQIPITIVAGGARPSLCRLVPNRGPAPLADLQISGANFSTNAANARLHFWQRGAVGDNLATWLPLPGSGFSSFTSERISAPIPVNPITHYSMQTGPIVLTVGGIRSNVMQYTVEDCRGQPSRQGYNCCTVGPDAGLWRDARFTCAGETRTAGYAWRFTTGLIPQVPQVVEECTNPPTVAPDPPSPAPWQGAAGQERLGGKSVCVTPMIAVRFNINMDTATLNTSNVQLLNCGPGDAPNCSSHATVQITVPSPAPRFMSLRQNPLVPNTWYRVVLFGEIRSRESLRVLGVDRIVNTPLAHTRSCGRVDGRDTAYCFDFKTRGDATACRLASVGITPPAYTATGLGPLYDPPNSQLPFYYYLWGRGEDACTLVNADGLGWNWSVNDPNPLASGQARASVRPASTQGWDETRATAAALFPTAPNYVNITAQTPAYSAASRLKIELGEPTVDSYWPACLANAGACVNASIGARFSRDMWIQDYQVGISLYKCLNGETCSPNGSPNRNLLPIALQFRIQEGRRFEAAPRPPTTLEADSWYQVEISPSIHAVGGYDANNNPIQGPGLTRRFVWKFKTKNDATACAVSSVQVEPSQFTAHTIGEKTRYGAVPVGAADACNANGQRLDALSYGWSWSIPDAPASRVASVTNFSFLGPVKSYCTAECLPKGSSVASENRLALGGLCGNGQLDPGEDCDIEMTGEIPGVSCSFSCLRPGNNNPNQCGNGRVDSLAGEQCDTADPATRAYCTSNCLWTGSAPATGNNTSTVSNIGAPVCGSGGITNGESCEIGVVALLPARHNGPDTATTCSDRCLHLGTPLARAWCDTHPNVLMGTVNASQSAECRRAVSVCGNGRLESDEECEVITGQVYVFNPDNPASPILTNAQVAPVSSCTNHCTLVNICGTNVPTETANHLPYLRCARGTPGCNNDCTLAGSSVSYPNSSVCSDGELGIGESAWCEYTAAEAQSLRQQLTASRQTLPIQNSVQAVTAVGLGTVATADNAQHTQVNASVTAARQINQSQIIFQSIATAAAGSGNYALQCGYTEYEAARAGRYNDCPASGQGNQGVGSNSCCYVRPSRTVAYPRDQEGLAGGTARVCLNTAISITFNANIDEQTLPNNIIVARGASTPACATGELDVSQLISRTLLADNRNPGRHETLFAFVWQWIHNLASYIFAPSAHASGYSSSAATAAGVRVWCSGAVSAVPQVTHSVNPVITKIDVNLQKLLDENAIYAVFLRGGPTGIKDIRGVGIGAGQNGRDDSFVFRVGTEICKLKSVTVNPPSQLFSTPNTGQDNPTNAYVFTAIASSTNDQRITSIAGVYAWNWDWGPTASQIFNIPVNNSTGINIRSRSVQGRATAFARATITAGPDAANSDRDKVFSGNTELTALFCEHPWPAVADYPYRDNNFNFSMGYCADGNLPYLRPVVQGPGATTPVTGGTAMPGSPVISDALKQFLFFNSQTQNSDVIGIQVFDNTTRLAGGSRARVSAREWYRRRFGTVPASFRDATVDGYDAITDGNTYYINALNVRDRIIRDTIDNYIFLISINPQAQPNTRTVFTALMNSLRFNTNITDMGYCSVGDGSQSAHFDTPTNPNVACTTDFDDCGVTGGGQRRICANAKTKLQRDWARLQQIGSMQQKIEDARVAGGSYPALASGTFVPGYTNSRWPSWSRLVSGGLAHDPVDQWRSCGNNEPQTCWDALQSRFICPAQAQVYEYKIESSPTGINYHLFSQLEYITSGSILSDIVDTNHFVNGRSCQGGQSYSPNPGACGDGIINPPGEQCDPPGSQVPDQSVSTAILGQSFCEYQVTRKQCAPSVCPVSRLTAAVADKAYIAKNFKDYVCVYTTRGTGVATVHQLIYRSNTPALPQTGREIVPYPCSVGDSRGCVNQLEPGWQQRILGASQPSAQENNVGCQRISEINVYDSVATRDNGQAQCVATVDSTITCRATQTCDITCHLTGGSCAATNCGNGRINPPEICDDGALNGTYGHCDNTCLHPFAAWCGNGTLDCLSANGTPIVCPATQTTDTSIRHLEYCEKNDPRFTGTGFCLKESCRNGKYNINGWRILRGSSISDFRGVSFVNPEAVWAVGNNATDPSHSVGYIFKKSTGWEQQFNTLSTENNTIQGVFFRDTLHGWAVGSVNRVMAIWRTIDGGANWSVSTFSNPSLSVLPAWATDNSNNLKLYSVYFVNNSDGWAVGDRGVVMYSNNGGESWRQQGDPLLALALRSIYFVPGTSVGWVVGDSGIIYKTNNSGASWSQQGYQSGQNLTSKTLNSVFFTSPLVGWIVGSRGFFEGAYGGGGRITGPSIFRTSDGGQTWTSLNVPITALLPGSGPFSQYWSNVGGPEFNVEFFTVTFVDSMHGFVAGRQGSEAALYVTSDGGDTWQRQYVPVPSGYAGDRTIRGISIKNANGGFIVGGGNIYELMPDPYCEEVTHCSDDAPCHSGDFCVAINDPAYKANKENSCALDCQGTGGYCGDGMVQTGADTAHPYEECDDGVRNGTPGSSCNKLCFRLATPVPARNPTPQCGDGIVDTSASEVCDTGSTSNGVACTPTYGHACTYCAADCRSILTVDATAYCGNGRIDQVGVDSRGQPAYEKCDIRHDSTLGDVVIGEIVNGTRDKICPDRGRYTCTDRCANLKNECVTCGVKPLNVGGFTAQISVLNPMIYPSRWRATTPAGETASAEESAARAWGSQTVIAVGTSNYASRISYGAALSENPLTLPIESGFGIENNRQCSSAYHFEFLRPGDTTHRDITGDPLADVLGNYFIYPVTGEERGAVRNEVVVSPPLPRDPDAPSDEKHLRIVVRWTDAENTRASFNGNLFNMAFTGIDNPSGSRNRTIGYPLGVPLCSGVSISDPNSRGERFWQPTGCDGYEGHSVYVHPIVGLEHTFVQAMTVNAGAGTVGANTDSAINKNYAFFVSEVVGQPISAFRNSRLTVEVYTYHNGQNSLYSIYKPEPAYTFSMANAENTAINPNAAHYWHVFNIVRTDTGGGVYRYMVRPLGAGAGANGRIESSFRDVECNLLYAGRSCPLPQ